MVLIWLFIGLLFSVAMVIIFLYQAAQNDQQATFVEEGTIKFVVGGENLIDILVNVDGHTLEFEESTGRTKIVKVSEKRASFRLPHIVFRDWLRERFGFYWISIFYPVIKIHEFEIQKSRLKQNMPENTPVLKLVETDEGKSIQTYLLFTFTHPVAISNIETKEGGAIDLVLLVTIQVVYPYIAVMLLKGKFFEPFDELVRSCVIRHFSDVGYLDFRNNPEEKTQLIDKIMEANNPTDNNPQSGIVHSVGLRVTQVAISGYDLTTENKALTEAYRANEIQEKLGQAKVTAADYALRAAEKTAMAAAAPTKELIATMQGADDKTRQLVAQMDMVKNLSGPDSKVTVLGNSPFITTLTQSAPDTNGQPREPKKSEPVEK